MTYALLAILTALSGTPEEPSSWTLAPTALMRISMVSDLLDDRYDEQIYLSYLVGALLMTRAPGPYILGGLELEAIEMIDGRKATYVLPVVRVGMAWQDLDNGIAKNVKEFEPISRIRLYGVLGVRPASMTRGDALRLGVGIHSTSAMFMSMFHLPANLELMTEHDGRSRPIVSLRLGWGF